MAIEMQQCDPVVPGQRRIGQKRRKASQHIGAGGKASQFFGDAGGDDLNVSPQPARFEPCL